MSNALGNFELFYEDMAPNIFGHKIKMKDYNEVQILRALAKHL